jgi:hypothetical protein
MTRWQPGIVREPIEPCACAHIEEGFDIPGSLGKRIRVRPAASPNVQDALPCELEIHPEDVRVVLERVMEDGIVLVVCDKAVATD